MLGLDYWVSMLEFQVEQRNRSRKQERKIAALNRLTTKAPYKGLREPETGRHFAPAIRRHPQQRPEVPLRPARMSRKAGDFSRDRRKPHLRGTAWWWTQPSATSLHPQFPDNREINREFFDFGPFSAI